MKLISVLTPWQRAFLLYFGLWALLCALAGITTMGDAELAGDRRSYWSITLGWWCGYLVLMLEGYLLFLVVRRHRALLATARRIVAGYLVFIVFGWPAAMLGLAFRRLLKSDHVPTLARTWEHVGEMDKFEWFVVFVLMTMTFGAVVAALLWRQRQQQAGELAQARLALETQRLAALRGQLEPHFLFNTLSAIGTLVQVDDKPHAVDGLARLGALLRYVLESGEREWVGLAQEWGFVDDYLDLQRLRFGNRLRVRVDGVHWLDEGIECPPMLLQPLLENALRHDLEAQPGPSDIVVAFVGAGPDLLVQVSNPVASAAAPKAGLGIGLRGTAARLRLAYGDAASIGTRIAAGRFIAELRIPRSAPA